MVHRENIELNTCPILFIIGNGFDLGLGMKTRYEDVYDGYIHTSPKVLLYHLPFQKRQVVIQIQFNKCRYSSAG